MYLLCHLYAWIAIHDGPIFWTEPVNQIKGLKLGPNHSVEKTHVPMLAGKELD